MTTYRIISVIVAAFLLANSHANDKPNVLLIAIDDLNDWIGCMDGHPQSLTPNIDKLAARGTLFTNAHCQAPICGPSRASLLSGRYPHETGVYNQPKGGNALSTDPIFFDGQLLPQYFAKNGYTTYGVGKITHGYDQEATFLYTGSKGNSGPKPEGPKAPNDVRFNYRPNYELPYTGTQTDWGAFPDRDDEMPDHQTASWIIPHIAKEHDKPFFMAVGFHRPHVPFYAPQEWFDMHPLENIILPEIPYDDLSDVPEIGRLIHELPRYPDIDWLRANDNEQLRLCVQAYLACTTFVDAQVGRVLDALESSPHADNTIIVLFSDHGYHIGEKERVSKQGLWEESTKVPFIIATPNGQGLEKRHQPVGLIDIYPTLIDLCDLPKRPQNAGRSLVPLVENSGTSWRHSIITTYAKNNHTLRSNRFRYIRYEDGSEELYDHFRDSHEWTNLANYPEYTSELETFRKNLPKDNAPYHPIVGSGPINPWFAEHYERLGVDNR